MPIYEYECQLCHHHFELRQSFSDEPVTACPKCQGTVRRVLCPSPIIFKGSGFYVTDIRGKDPDSLSPPGAASDTKPAAQTEPKKS